MKEEKEDNLVESFERSIGVDIAEFAGDTIEFGADLCMEDGILKDIPFVGTAFKLYHIGSRVHDNHCLKKLCSFISAINDETCSKEIKEKRHRKFVENKEYRKQELEYLLILVERYIGLEKPQMLAKIYLAYLDNYINWTELTQYAEIIDRLLPGDQEFLLQNKALFHTISIPISDAFLRLGCI